MTAKRPFLIVGGGGWSAEACADLMGFAEAMHLPVGASFRCQDYFDNHHPNYAGHVGIGIDPELAARIKGADLLIVLLSTDLAEHPGDNLVKGAAGGAMQWMNRLFEQPETMGLDGLAPAWT